MKEYMRLGVLNRALGKLGVFIVEGEREVTWQETITITIILRNYCNIGIKEVIIKDFWHDWAILDEEKSNINNKPLSIGKDGTIILKKLNEHGICIVECKLKIKNDSGRYIKQSINVDFKYIGESHGLDYHKAKSEELRLKIYEKLIKDVDIEKDVFGSPQNHPIYTPLNYDAKLEITNIRFIEDNERKNRTSVLEGKVYINIYYESDTGNFDNIQQIIPFTTDTDIVNIKREELYLSIQKLLIKIIDSKRLLTSIKFNIYKTSVA